MDLKAGMNLVDGDEWKKKMSDAVVTGYPQRLNSDHQLGPSHARQGGLRDSSSLLERSQLSGVSLLSLLVPLVVDKVSIPSSPPSF